MPSFDVVSEVDMAEVRNACDQCSREVTNRFDFKGTEPKIDLGDDEITLEADTEQRLKALITVLEEKFVKRKVSLKSLEWGPVEEATKGRARQKAKIIMGITTEKAKEIGKYVKGLNLKGIQHQIQGDQLRISGKVRDSLQDVIAKLKEKDFGLPLQYTNFRD